jgi:uncharacterized protein
MAIASPIRKTSVQLTIAGADATAALAPYLMGFEAEDSMDVDCNADVITIRLANPDFRFLTAWNLDKGTEIQASILMYNWAGIGEGLKLDCGTFFVDTIDYSGPPNVCIIKATSIPTTGSFKGFRHNQAFENSTIKDICTKMAGDAGMTVNYMPNRNPVIDRFDQDEEGDSFAIKRLCDRNGMNVKLQDKTLIITDEALLDTQAPWIGFTLGVTPIIHYTLTTTNQKTVGSMKTSYMNPVTGQTKNDEWVPPVPPEGRDGQDTENDRPDDDSDKGD